MNAIGPVELTRMALANVQMALHALRAAQEMIGDLGEESTHWQTMREIAQTCRWLARRADAIAERIEAEDWMANRLEGGSHG
jgi:glutamyl-tRNA reductase